MKNQITMQSLIGAVSPTFTYSLVCGVHHHRLDYSGVRRWVWDSSRTTTWEGLQAFLKSGMDAQYAER